MADTTAELLAILSSVQPLLLPDLPSPPPSPSPSHSQLHPQSNGKRKLEDPTETLRTDDSKRPRGGPPRPPPPPPPSIDLKPPTPELTSHARLNPPPPPPASSVSTKTSPRLNGNVSLNGGNASSSQGEPEWRKDWPKERLRKLGAQCRDHGRRLKHSGDSLARRSSSPSTILLSLAHQLDAILLYVFAFWCDDTASKTCLKENWSSVFGLIGFVKKMAEKENQGGLMIGICLRMEAIAVYTLSMHEQKALFYKATQLSTSTSTSSNSRSTTSSSSSNRAPPPPPPGRPPPPPPPPAPGPSDQPSPASSSSTSITAASPSTQSHSLPHQQQQQQQQQSPVHSNSTALHPLPPGLPPPPPPPPPPSATSTTSNLTKTAGTGQEEFIKQFLKASPELFRFQKLYDESCTLLVLVGPSTRPFEDDCTMMMGGQKVSTTTTMIELVLPNPTSLSGLGRGRSIEEGELGGATTTTEESNEEEEVQPPIELARGSGSLNGQLMVPSQVLFARTVLKKWIERKGLDFEFVTIGV
ncbi:hypothetical protein JCM16303_003118 [Sporobolomyces ruberrimus]